MPEPAPRRGEVWLADQAENVFVLRLEHEEGLSISGKSILCSSLSYEIRRVRGVGWLGSTIGCPCDTDAAIGWSKDSGRGSTDRRG